MTNKEENELYGHVHDRSFPILLHPTDMKFPSTLYKMQRLRQRTRHVVSNDSASDSADDNKTPVEASTKTKLVVELRGSALEAFQAIVLGT